MQTHITPAFTPTHALAAALIAVVYIALNSLIKEPVRQRLNALVIAGAGAVYWSGGLGLYEFWFGPVMIFMAYKGLTDYRYIGAGWLLHSGWDAVHHLYGNPIVAFSPSSSGGCAVCDSILAFWFFAGAPTIFTLFKKPNTHTTI